MARIKSLIPAILLLVSLLASGCCGKPLESQNDESGDGDEVLSSSEMSEIESLEDVDLEQNFLLRNNPALFVPVPSFPNWSHHPFLSRFPSKGEKVRGSALSSSYNPTFYDGAPLKKRGMPYASSVYQKPTFPQSYNYQGMMLRSGGGAGLGSGSGGGRHVTGFFPRKRQILFRQCFFNPISCF